jgi:hypothetical protein
MVHGGIAANPLLCIAEKELLGWIRVFFRSDFEFSDAATEMAAEPNAQFLWKQEKDPE